MKNHLTYGGRQAVLCVLATALALAAQEWPLGIDPDKFPARDSHEGVILAARPIPDTPEAEKIFGETAAPTRAGFLPVELVIVNEREDHIRVNLQRIQVVTDEEKFEQVEPEEIAWGLYPPPTRQPTDSSRLPRRLPRDKNRYKREEAQAALRSHQLRAAVVPPGTSARGYLYFDLRGGSIHLKEAWVYVPEVKVVPTDQPLFFFEISLELYAEE
ncbi:MAG: hypothetical protein ACE5G6_02655 [Terriglobia bacterium]